MAIPRRTRDRDAKYDGYARARSVAPDVVGFILHVSYVVRITIAICVILFSTSSFCDDRHMGYAPLVIKRVLPNPKCEVPEGYEYGADRVPDYKIEGLSDCFLIKTSPDLMISPDNITHISISTAEFNYTSTAIYMVNIQFRGPAVKLLQDYLGGLINSRIVFEIDDHILALPVVLGQVDADITFTVGGKSLYEIEKDLYKICSSIDTEKAR